MRVAIIGQQDFGKSVLEAFLARGDEVAGVFCAPENNNNYLGAVAGISHFPFPIEEETEPRRVHALLLPQLEIGNGKLEMTRASHRVSTIAKYSPA